MSIASHRQPQVDRLGPADLAELVALYDAVAAGLPRGQMRPRDAANLAPYLGGAEGAAFGIREDGRLVAAALLGQPRQRAGVALPRFPGIPAADWPAKVAFAESAVVLPAARGRG